ncbi:MAG: YeeE/YedE family protein [Aliivibrio sp.]|uniref:DUF6691 family protein n=1 Tax=Aliivibrio sp. TaxID=1872443 RepID=UPI001A41D61D|nr:YeeE/YedE family protein [Aliivibrio sp.]
MNRFIALVSGLLFGFGMMISGMVDPNNVLNFLDLAGSWDPSLLFVMGGAVMVFMPIYLLVIKKMGRPLCHTEFHLPKKNKIDFRLVTGSLAFGVGWGIAGFCPGPVVTSLSSGNSTVYLFISTMLIGIWLGSIIANRSNPELVVTQETSH